MLAGFAQLFPCDVYMETGPAAGGGKNALQVKLFVELIHRRCPVDIEKTRLVAAGAAIASQGQWKKVAAGIYEKDLVVSLNGKSQGEIRVLRDCPDRPAGRDTGHRPRLTARTRRQPPNRLSVMRERAY